ncbi:hypothetical protein LEMLEM_LOCUS26707, partial [Lemmus lemmus]
GLLELLRALDGVRLVFGPPLGHLAVGLGQRPLQLSFALLLLLILFPQQVTVMARGLQGVGQRVLGLKKIKRYPNRLGLCVPPKPGMTCYHHRLNEVAFFFFFNLAFSLQVPFENGTKKASFSMGTLLSSSSCLLSSSIC